MKTIWILQLAACLMLLLALAPWPYAYYILMRWIVCIAACVAALDSYKEAKSMSVWVCIFGLLAILFNPIAPIHFPRQVWAGVDIVAAVLFGLNAVIRFKSIKQDLPDR